MGANEREKEIWNGFKPQRDFKNSTVFYACIRKAN
jgi:hypothetical protein